MEPSGSKTARLESGEVNKIVSLVHTPNLLAGSEWEDKLTGWFHHSDIPKEEQVVEILEKYCQA